MVGGSGNDTLVSNLGDDSLFGGTGNDLFLINPGQDPAHQSTPAGFNILDFSIAALGITLEPQSEYRSAADRRLPLATW